MGRAPCCSKVGLNRGPWTAREDMLLIKYIQTHGEGHWRSLPKKAGLLRCGKSCRLRWLNYLRPDIKRGNITPDEDDLIIRLHSLLGNRWSLIAGRLPGRTDNEIKNYWNSHLSKKINMTVDVKRNAGKNNTNTTKTNNKRKQNKDNQVQGMGNGEQTITKIHFPKAIRVSPFSKITRNNSSVDSMISHGDDNKGAHHVTEVLDLPLCWSYLIDSNNGGQALTSDKEHDLINGCNTSFLNSIPANDNMLDKMFEEYQQLLVAEDHVQVDSFIDSLLI